MSNDHTNHTISISNLGLYHPIHNDGKFHSIILDERGKLLLIFQGSLRKVEIEKKSLQKIVKLSFDTELNEKMELINFSSSVIKKSETEGEIMKNTNNDWPKINLESKDSLVDKTDVTFSFNQNNTNLLRIPKIDDRDIANPNESLKKLQTQNKVQSQFLLNRIEQMKNSQKISTEETPKLEKKSEDQTEWKERSAPKRFSAKQIVLKPVTVVKKLLENEESEEDKEDSEEEVEEKIGRNTVKRLSVNIINNTDKKLFPISKNY